MGRALVESAGYPLNADAVKRWVSEHGRVGARQPLGRVTATWRLVDSPLRLEVSHPRPTSVLTTILGQAPEGEPERYAVPVLTQRPDGRTGRWWFVCPRCGQRCGRLYLPTGMSRVGCRKCCGLLYRSQFTRSHGRTNTRRSLWG